MDTLPEMLTPKLRNIMHQKLFGEAVATCISSICVYMVYVLDVFYYERAPWIGLCRDPPEKRPCVDPTPQSVSSGLEKRNVIPMMMANPNTCPQWVEKGPNESCHSLIFLMDIDPKRTTTSGEGTLRRCWVMCHLLPFTTKALPFHLNVNDGGGYFEALLSL